MRKNLALIFTLCFAAVMSACNGSSDDVNADLLAVTEDSLVVESVFTTVNGTAPVSERADSDSSGGTVPTFETIIVDVNTEKNPPDKISNAVEITPPGYVPKDKSSEDEEYPKLTPATWLAAVELLNDFSVFGAELYGIPLTADDVSILKYYGTYNGCEVVVMYPKGLERTADEIDIVVGDWQLSLPSGSLDIFLHKDGTFLKISEAYEKGLLTKSDMKAIAYYNQHEEKISQLSPWQFSDLPPIDASRERKIRADYAKLQSEKLGWELEYPDVSVGAYYGTYNGREVVVMYVNEKAYTADMKYFNLAGYEFALSSGELDIHVYKNGEFIELSEAYKTGYLGDEDIDMIAFYNHNPSRYISLAGDYPEPETLSEEAARQIREDYAKFIGTDRENIVIENYYGTYNGGEAVVMYRGYATCDENHFSVAGYEMYLPSGSLRIHIHKDGTFYELSEAYESGLLSKEDVAIIAHYNGEGCNCRFTE